MPTINDFISGGPPPKLSTDVLATGSNEHLYIDFGAWQQVIVKPHNGRLESVPGMDNFLKSFIKDAREILDQLDGVEYIEKFGVAPEWE